MDLLSRSFRSGMEFEDLFGGGKVMWSDLLKIDAA